MINHKAVNTAVTTAVYLFAVFELKDSFDWMFTTEKMFTMMRLDLLLEVGTFVFPTKHASDRFPLQNHLDNAEKGNGIRGSQGRLDSLVVFAQTIGWKPHTHTLKSDPLC